MIFDITRRLTQYDSIHHLFPAAAKFLARTDLADLPDGRHDIRGNEIYALITRAVGKARDDAKLEIHNAYIDIQIVLQGTDSIGWKPRSTCMHAISDYDPKNDFQLFSDHPDTWLQVHSGQFAVFFPDDAHAPMVADELLHKIVIKVAK